MGKNLFRFKQFECQHGRSSIKIGVDAVMLGAWVDVMQKKNILDVGTGCGVIALMCAQRNAYAQVEAIDIDSNSVDEASLNFANSPWKNRLIAKQKDFSHVDIRGLDLIVSNPPYFDSGIKTPDTSRLMARHEDTLSAEIMLNKCAKEMDSNCTLCIVYPALRYETLAKTATSIGMDIVRALKVKGNPATEPKRVLLEFKKGEGKVPTLDQIETLIIENNPGDFTDSYRILCHDFYLKF